MKKTTSKKKKSTPLLKKGAAKSTSKIKKPTSKQLMYGGLALFLGLMFFGVTKAISNGRPNSNSNVDKYTISDHDEFYDYKLENGVWYTKRKAMTEWIPMRENLTEQQYLAATNDLTAFMRNKGINI